ncbi:MAG: hypothetical protein ACXAC7_19800 [Candidatus Hodarchaeales archaeon]
MTNVLTCKKCGSVDFKQIGIDTYECILCFTTRKAGKKLVHRRRKVLPKKSISISADYNPIILNCEVCHQEIGRMGTPKDFKRLKNQWKNHICEKQKSSEEDHLSYI